MFLSFYTLLFSQYTLNKDIESSDVSTSSQPPSLRSNIRHKRTTTKELDSRKNLFVGGLDLEVRALKIL